MPMVPPSLPPTGAPGFDNIDFAVGQVRGVRTWRVREDLDTPGMLEGMFYRQLWLPGENVALCRAMALPRSMIPGLAETDPTPPVYAEPKEGHLPGCRCGFYAYYNGSNDYYTGTARSESLVTGVIEGYGEVLVGTKGFRCTRARIVALMLQPEVTLHDMVLEHYSVPIFHDFDMMIRQFPEEDGGARAHGPREDPDDE